MFLHKAWKFRSLLFRCLMYFLSLFHWQINAEFMRITTLPLQAKFFGQHDQYTPNLMKVFSSGGGAARKKLRLLMAPTAKASALNYCIIILLLSPLPAPLLAPPSAPVLTPLLVPLSAPVLTPLLAPLLAPPLLTPFSAPLDTQSS